FSTVPVMKLLIVSIITLSSFSSAIVIPSCNGWDCPDGQRCELQIVQCFAPPCEPLPTCVANSSECVLPCPLGQRCVLQTIQCLRAPCPPAKPRCMSLVSSSTAAGGY
ncbi:hypothetical protein PENTCL1PPCAC_29026, partial [Pristionchus entomophagus]